MKTFIQICRKLKNDQYQTFDFYTTHGRIVDNIHKKISDAYQEYRVYKENYTPDRIVLNDCRIG